jgi:hypothetical protein
MAGMGPPPKHPSQRRRTNPTLALTQLPPEGRKGKTPPWPLIDDVAMTTRRDLAAAKVRELEEERRQLEVEGRSSGRVELRLDIAQERLAILTARLAEQRRLEAALWRALWKTPQATQWERLEWTRDVAQYVRHKVLGELGELDDAREARQWSDRLGLTPLAMLRLRWEVAADAAGDVGDGDDEPDAPVADVRKLFAV